MYIINSKEREKHDGFCSPDKSQIPRDLRKLGNLGEWKGNT